MRDNHQPIHATFVMEQHLGHGTFYQNLRTALDKNPALDASWVEVSYGHTGTWWEQFSMLPANVRGTLRGRAQVRQGLRCQHHDVAFFNTQVPAALGGRIAQKRPYVVCTDITPVQYDRMHQYYDHQPDRNTLLRRYKHWVNTHLLQQAARVIPWSTWVRASLIEEYGVQPERITVIPPGVDTNRWHPGPQKGSDQPLRILFVGGDFERKGGDILLQAFRRLDPGTAELILVTRTPVAPEAGVIVRNDLVANTAELVTLFQTSDLFVLPTRAEAFGIAAAEASAVGLPIITTAVGGLSDIVLDQVTGYLVEADAVEQLALCMQKLAMDEPLRRQMGERARHHALTYFDAQKNAQRILQVLKEVVIQ